MNFKTTTFIAVGSLLWQLAFAAPPRVTNVVAAQRPDTKLVDITYNLDLDEGETAYVEIWFSHDNGRSFPISADAVSGHVDEGMTAGNKAVVWDAEEDWDQRFTQQGKIRELQAELDLQKRRYEAILASSSWKMTAPFRKSGRVLRKLLSKRPF